MIWHRCQKAPKTGEESGAMAEITIPIDEATARTQAVVQQGSTVVLERDDGRANVYQVVSFVESDPAHGKIGDRSPFGAALLGKHTGDSVMVKIPAGVRELRIKEVR
jgi:transcription elongation GreA/GreB family factor